MYYYDDDMNIEELVEHKDKLAGILNKKVLEKQKKKEIIEKGLFNAYEKIASLQDEEDFIMEVWNEKIKDVVKKDFSLVHHHNYLTCVDYSKEKNSKGEYYSIKISFLEEEVFALDKGRDDVSDEDISKIESFVALISKNKS